MKALAVILVLAIVASCDAAKGKLYKLSDAEFARMTPASVAQYASLMSASFLEEMQTTLDFKYLHVIQDPYATHSSFMEVYSGLLSEDVHAQLNDVVVAKKQYLEAVIDALDFTEEEMQSDAFLEAKRQLDNGVWDWFVEKKNEVVAAVSNVVTTGENMVKQGIKETKVMVQNAEQAVVQTVDNWAGDAAAVMTKVKAKVVATTQALMTKAQTEYNALKAKVAAAAGKAKQLLQVAMTKAMNAMTQLKKMVGKIGTLVHQLWDKNKCNLCSKAVGFLTGKIVSTVQGKATQWIATQACKVITPPIANNLCPPILTPLAGECGPLAPLCAKGACVLAKPLIQRACQWGMGKLVSYLLTQAGKAASKTALGQKIAAFFAPKNLCGMIKLC